jgi:hypothetical protein
MKNGLPFGLRLIREGAPFSASDKICFVFSLNSQG